MNKTKCTKIKKKIILTGFFVVYLIRHLQGATTICGFIKLKNGEAITLTFTIIIDTYIETERIKE